MKTHLHVDGERLWQSLMDMAEIGPSPNGGSRRLALTRADYEGRARLLEWCRELGCTVRTDDIGNLFIRRPGLDDSLEPVATGSHLDTQPLGGRFDGILGVLAGLEVFRTLEQHGIRTRRPLELVVWTNEEGSRFAPAMMGSAVFTGQLPLAEALATTDHQGISVREALDSFPFIQPGTAPEQPFHAFFELHIEQGPVLENEQLDIGVVTGAQGIRWYDIRLAGVSAHAGPTPMRYRRDPLLALAAFVRQLQTIVSAGDPDCGRFTIGELSVTEPSRNVIPGEITLTLDLRHESEQALEAMETQVLAALEQTASEAGVSASCERRWISPQQPFDEKCVRLVEQTTQALGYSYRSMMSGAGHDSVNITRVAPCAMIFVPCRDGISHNEAEYADPESCRKGADVLLNAILKAAQ